MTYTSTDAPDNTGMGAHNPGGWTGPYISASGTNVPHSYPMTGNGVEFDFRLRDLNEQCLGGHITSLDNIEYVDGVVVSYCERCAARIEISRVPGGISMLRLKTLLGSAMALEELDDETGLSDVLGDYQVLSDAIAEEEFQLRQARKLLALAGELIEKKVTARPE